MEKFDKLIYLDWNIFQDLKQNRNGKELEYLIKDAKQRNYIIPYSYSHIRDLSRCTSKSYVADDIQFISSFCDNYCLAYNAKNEEDFWIKKEDPKKVLNFLLVKNQKMNISNKNILIPTYKIDNTDIQKDNLLYPYLEKNNFIMTSDLFNQIISDLYPSIFFDNEKQKIFRSSLIEIVKIQNPAFLDFPVYKYLLANKESIENNFSEIFSSFLRLSNKSEQKIPFGEKITTASNMLDFFPAFSEKIGKKNNINNISTDSEHMFWGTSSKYYITNDKKYYEKINFLYNYFKIKTKVYLKERFNYTMGAIFPESDTGDACTAYA
ncbi:MAG: hypothetical protein ACTTKL_11305, partial [Treponema sp.]